MTEAQILLARELLAEPNSTITAVAEHVGVAVATLYRHVPELRGSRKIGGRRSKTMEQAQIDRARELLAAPNSNVRAVAKELGFSLAALYKQVPGLKGSRTPGSGPGVTPEQIDRARELLAQPNSTRRAVAKELGFSTNTLRKYLAGGKDATPRKRDGQSTVNKGLTGKEIIDFMEQRARLGMTPASLREMADAVGLRSASSVEHHLKKLEAVGLVCNSPGSARGWRLADRPVKEDGLVRAPLMTAGPGRKAVQAGGSLILPHQLVGSGENYLVRMPDHSMSGSGIFPGDLLAIDGHCTPAHQEVVAAVIDGTLTARRLIRTDTLWLIPDNSSFARISATYGMILGKAVTVVRSLAGSIPADGES
ncbi:MULTISPECIES: helix-turn-helix domain-containing protein [unclassified Streptomyces]|uniref:helix-turn-helix domain-containing protein n=1 Tax=unclassified Streptomyces TaxID=2593676 RepID=UPI000B82AD51|nr:MULTISPECIES: helix-turn-helix domain-containing protein [unclassified Streptomyces]MYZ35116.1 helix-turn-helix domain-containing protein [Streptomyces sp. SID4917]